MAKVFARNTKDAGSSPARRYSFPCQIASREKLFIIYFIKSSIGLFFTLCVFLLASRILHQMYISHMIRKFYENNYRAKFEMKLHYTTNK